VCILAACSWLLLRGGSVDALVPGYTMTRDTKTNLEFSSRLCLSLGLVSFVVLLYSLPHPDDCM
jgi:hypothetical protein